MISILSYLLSYIIPIKSKFLLFSSSPDYCDNAYAVFSYLANKERNKYTYIWIVENKSKVQELINKDFSHLNLSIKILRRNSFISYWYVFRSKLLFYTVGIYSAFLFHQKNKRINLWHGMPIKHIGFNFQHGDITIATSEIFAKKMSLGLNIPEKNVLVVGQPRNDFLFHPELFPGDEYGLNEYQRIGIWMPTFRRSKEMPQYMDGDFYDKGISFVSLKQLDDINELLKENNSLMFIKFHPYDVFQEKKISDYTNIRFLYNYNFTQKDIYKLMSHCDFLISDYSSVVIDYEILNRPIGITMDDFESYKKTRGFDTEDIPGEYLYNYNDFYKFVSDNVTCKYLVQDYGNVYNTYKDDKSTYRLLLSLKIIDNAE